VTSDCIRTDPNHKICRIQPESSRRKLATKNCCYRSRASLDLLRGATLPKPGANDPAPASFIVPLRYRLTP
jgi:hypothetical protein